LSEYISISRSVTNKLIAKETVLRVQIRLD
jgi:hypothetical protein